MDYKIDYSKQLISITIGYITTSDLLETLY